MNKTFIYNLLSYGLVIKDKKLYIVNAPDTFIKDAKISLIIKKYKLFGGKVSYLYEDKRGNLFRLNNRIVKELPENSIKVYYLEEGNELYPSITFEELENRCLQFDTKQQLYSVMSFMEKGENELYIDYLINTIL